VPVVILMTGRPAGTGSPMVALIGRMAAPSHPVVVGFSFM
jgi:hypothetical protein